MKKERYFRHELERMFIAYAIVPAVVFTLVCGLLFMTVLLHGKKSGNIEHNRYVAGLLDNVLARYEDGVEEMASQPGLFDRVRDQDGKAELSGKFYGITNSLGLEGDLFVMDSSRSILLSSRSVTSLRSWMCRRACPGAYLTIWTGSPTGRLLSWRKDGKTAAVRLS